MSGNYPPPGGNPDPYGPPDPYRQEQPYGGQQDPSGQTGYPPRYGRPDFMPTEPTYYAQQGWGRGYYGEPMYGPPGAGSADTGIQVNAIIALVVSALTLLSCCNLFAVGGVVCSIIALNKWRAQPEAARKLNMWAWISTGGGVVLAVLIYVGSLVFSFLPVLPLLWGGSDF